MSDPARDIELPELERARKRLTVIKGRTKVAVLKRRYLTREEKIAGEAIEYPDVERPQTRGDCADMPRPCPFVSCVHHLYLDVIDNGRSETIKLNFPHIEPWEMEESCSLDVADRGEHTLDQVAARLNVVRERVRQIESKALRKLRRENPDMRGFAEGSGTP